MTTIVLAAGRSRRFGRTNKLLAGIHGVPLVVLTLRRVLAATDGPVCLVTGYQAHHLRATLTRFGLRSPRLRIVHNRHARAGMAGSLAHGLAAAPRISSAVQIHLGDMPGIDRGLVGKLHRALNQGARASRPMHHGRPGHPVRLRRDHLPVDSDIAKHGLRSVLYRLPDHAWHRFEAGRYCVADIDRRQMRRSLISEPLTRARLSGAGSSQHQPFSRHESDFKAK